VADQGMEVKFGVISTDDHLQEAPDVWTSRMSTAKFGDDIPQIVTMPDDTESWIVAGQPMPGLLALGEVQGAREDRAAPPPTHWSEIPTKTYVPADRLRAMDEDGVDGQTFFPNIAGITNGTFQTVGSEEYRLACMRAYNDWQAEEWYGFSRRFIPQCIFPLWDVQLAVDEVTRCHELGHRGIVANPNPDLLGFAHLNDPQWDPLWAACQELGMVVSFHVGGGAPVITWDGYTQNQSIAVRACRIIAGNSLFMANLLYSGILERFPALKVFSAESGIGWVAYLLETADHQYEAQKLWREGQQTLPSELFHRQCYSSFWYEKSAMKIRDQIGLKNIVWEGDFPHRTCTYPDSRKYIAASFEGVPDDDKRMILVDNAVSLFNVTTA
jgi:predicted TIM-barrel fold metal-dependent hydrolase